MKQVLVFDLHDTLVKEVSFSLQRGYAWLWETYLHSACTLDALNAYTGTFAEDFARRNVDNHEIHLVNDVVRRIFARFSVPMPADETQLERDLIDHTHEVALLDSVRDGLTALAERGIPMYVLSNSIYTENALRHLLDMFGILHLFGGVWSSADYGVRKPSADFFEPVFRDILALHPGLTKADLVYIGNDYRTDVTGAVGVGVDAIWYDAANRPDERGLAMAVVDDFRKLPALI